MGVRLYHIVFLDIFLRVTAVSVSPCPCSQQPTIQNQNVYKPATTYYPVVYTKPITRGPSLSPLLSNRITPSYLPKLLNNYVRPYLSQTNSAYSNIAPRCPNQHFAQTPQPTTGLPNVVNNYYIIPTNLLNNTNSKTLRSREEHHDLVLKSNGPYFQKPCDHVRTAANYRHENDNQNCIKQCESDINNIDIRNIYNGNKISKNTATQQIQIHTPEETNNKVYETSEAILKREQIIERPTEAVKNSANIHKTTNPIQNCGICSNVYRQSHIAPQNKIMECNKCNRCLCHTTTPELEHDCLDKSNQERKFISRRQPDMNEENNTSNENTLVLNKNYQDNHNYNTRLNQGISREDLVIKDFKRRFPYIPEELARKLMNYLKTSVSYPYLSILNPTYNGGISMQGTLNARLANMVQPKISQNSCIYPHEITYNPYPSHCHRRNEKCHLSNKYPYEEKTPSTNKINKKRRNKNKANNITSKLDERQNSINSKRDTFDKSSQSTLKAPVDEFTIDQTISKDHKLIGVMPQSASSVSTISEDAVNIEKPITNTHHLMPYTTPILKNDNRNKVNKDAIKDLNRKKSSNIEYDEKRHTIVVHMKPHKSNIATQKDKQRNQNPELGTEDAVPKVFINGLSDDINNPLYPIDEDIDMRTPFFYNKQESGENSTSLNSDFSKESLDSTLASISGEEETISFRTPPALEMPNFITRKVKIPRENIKEYPVFNKDDGDANSSPNLGSVSENEQLETVYAHSRVINYGKKEPNIEVTTEANLNIEEKKQRNSGDPTIVIAQSIPSLDYW